MSTPTRTSTLTRIGVLTGGAALVAAPLALVAAAPAQADVDRGGACGGGRYEFSIDRERGGFEVSADLDDVAPGSTWLVKLWHDGDRFAKRTLTADREGDVEIERFRTNSGGTDTFRFHAAKIGGSASCGKTIVVR